MKLRHTLMAAGVAIAAWLAVFGDKTPNGKVTEPVVRTTAPKARVAPQGIVTTASLFVASAPPPTTHHGKLKPEPVILALRPREELIGGASSGNKSDGLFGSQSWTPPPPPPPPSKPEVLPPPTAPAIPFKYIGKKVEDSIWEVYLARGESTFIVRENSVIEETYRINSIKPPTMSLTYLPLNQIQTLTIGGAD